MPKKTAAQLDAEIAEALAEANLGLRAPNLSNKAWKTLLDARSRFHKNWDEVYFPPVQPYDQQRMKVVRELIDRRFFVELQTDDEGRLFYTADVPKVEEAYAAWIAKNAPRKQLLSKDAKARLKQISKEAAVSAKPSKKIITN